MKNSEILLCKDIKLNKDYKNVLNYTEQQMLTLCRSQEHLIASNNKYSFIDNMDNQIVTSFIMKQCINANYIAFQNPRYANKWYFAFIDNVKYENDGSTRILFTIDVWSTFFSNLQFKQCFVIREHVNDDGIGKHTLPENVETGDYAMVTNPIVLNDYESGTYICVAVSEMISEVIMSEEENKRTFNGIYNGVYYCIHTSPEYATNLINIYEKKGKADAIVSVFLIPKAFILNESTIKLKSGVSEGIKYSFFVPSNNKSYYVINEDSYVNNVTSLNGGYIPKNKKLFTKQFNYMVLTNNNGIDIPLYYENFVNGQPHFKIIGDITPGCSTKCIPLDYNNYHQENEETELSSFNSGISGGKFPICSWSSDTYTNWLTENGVNIALGVGSALLGVGIGVATGGIGLVAVAGAGMSIANTIGSIYQHSLTPDQAKGNTNVGDVTYSAKKNVFDVIRMSIKPEYAKMIDNYFTRVGYLVNSLKIPNITGRRYWNYIQISNDDTFAYASIPHDYLEIINNIARSGVTIWHDHSSIGDFSLNNSII